MSMYGGLKRHHGLSGRAETRREWRNYSVLLLRDPPTLWAEKKS